MKVNITEDCLEDMKHIFTPYFVYRLKDKGFDFRMRCQRFKKGYADVDVGNLNTGFVDTIIEMLTQLRDNHIGYPGVKGAETPEKGDEILDNMIYYFKESTEESSRQNVYEEEYSKAVREFSEKYGMLGEKLQTEEDKAQKGSIRVYGPSDVKEYKDIMSKGLEDEKEVCTYRLKMREKGLNLFKKWFEDLWD